MATDRNRLTPYVILLFLLGVSYLTSLFNYLLFHSLAELFSIIIASCIFIIIANTHSLLTNRYLVVIGAAYLFVAILDSLHALGYPGMGIFEKSGTNLAAQLWIAARYFESAALVLAPLCISRQVKMQTVTALSFAACSLLIASIFFSDFFPTCFVEGSGLTPFKKTSEYIICLMLLIALVSLWHRKKAFSQEVIRLLTASILMTICAELAFTFYSQAYGLSNLIGHGFKIISFFLIYLAIIETSLSTPYNLLFRELKQSEEALTDARSRLEERVADRTRELKATNLELLKSRDQWEKTFNAIPDMVTIQDPHRKILRVNKAGCELAGQSPDELVGMYCFDIFRDKGMPCHDCPVKKTVADLQPRFMEISCGNKKTLWASSVPLFGDTGQLEAVVHIVKDISKIKQLEARMIQTQKLESIGMLAGGIAHDFNNILSPIFGYGEMVLDDLPKGSSLREYQGEIMIAAKRAKDLVRQILVFSKPTEQETNRVKVDLILKEALKLLKASIPSSIEIRQKIAPQCPAIQANPTQIHQLIMNLCTNAFQAMQDGEGILSLSLNETVITEQDSDFFNLPADTYLCLEVNDTGVGIPSEIRDKIFDPYFTTKSKRQGTGLGLATVSAIVQNHHGKISVYSEPGEGTTFRVYLPVSMALPNKSSATKQEESVTGGHERILLVDDDPTIVKMITCMLKSLGYDVTAHQDSEKALALFQHEPDAFDLIITDMTMPKITGAKLAQKVFDLRPDMPVILCTGYSELINHDLAIKMGIKAYLQKPVVRSKLAATIRQVLEGAPS